MGSLRGVAGHDFAGELELLGRDDGLVASWRYDGRFAARGILSPDDEPGVLQVVEDVPDGVVVPLLGLGVLLVFRLGRWHSVPVQALADVFSTVSGYGLVEDAPYDGRSYRIYDEDVVECVAAFLLYLLQLIAVGGPVARPVAAFSDFALAGSDLFAEVVGVELVYVLQDVVP